MFFCCEFFGFDIFIDLFVGVDVGIFVCDLEMSYMCMWLVWGKKCL